VTKDLQAIISGKKIKKWGPTLLLDVPLLNMLRFIVLQGSFLCVQW
jgi:hypothetical protein